MFNLQRDTCITNLASKIKEEDLKNCEDFIEARREARHYKTMERQKNKLEQLCQRNSRNSTERGGRSNQHGDHTCINTENIDISTADSSYNTIKKWVINISSKPLTKAQEKTAGPWAKLCCGPKKPTHCRIYCCGRTSVQQVKTRRGGKN